MTPVLDQLAVLLALVRCETQRPSHKVMVFFTTARQTQCMAEAFNAAGLPVLEIHSRKTQSHRNRVSEHFRTGSGLVLFSSDVSARGMDYPDVTCVVQVGMPSSQDQYIHRLGRTARGTADAGHAILLLSDFEAAGAASLRSLGVKDVPPPNAAAEAGAVQLCRKALAGDKGVTAVQVRPSETLSIPLCASPSFRNFRLGTVGGSVQKQIDMDCMMIHKIFMSIWP